jgi:prolyl-tRNA synthetase
VAPLQVVIVPIFNDETKAAVLEEARKVSGAISASFSSKLDDRDYLTPGRKFNEWELKGIPLRVEIGPRDIKQGQLVLVRRDNSQKRFVKIIDVVSEVGKELEAIQASLFQRALDALKARTNRATTYDGLKATLTSVGGVVQAPWCESHACEERVKVETGAKIINVPLGQEEADLTCVLCGKPAKALANFAKSY